MNLKTLLREYLNLAWRESEFADDPGLTRFQWSVHRVWEKLCDGTPLNDNDWKIIRKTGLPLDD